jgi:hypothetical protein
MGAYGGGNARLAERYKKDEYDNETDARATLH